VLRCSFQNLGCARRRVGAPKVEDAVWEKVKHILEHPESIAAMLASRRTEIESGGAVSELDRVQSVLDSIKRKEQRIVTAFVNEYVDEEGMATQISFPRERKEHFLEEITRLEAEASDAVSELDLLDSFQEAADSIRKSLGDLDGADRGEVIRLFASRIEVFADSINVVVLPSRGVIDKVTARPRLWAQP